MMKPQANSGFLRLAVVTAAAGLLTSLTTARTARADFFLHHWDDEYQPVGSGYFDGEFTYYSSSENFDPSGTKFSPTSLTNYNRYEGDALLSYGLFDRLSVFGRLTYGEVNLSATSNGGTAYGLMDQTVGATYHLYQKAPGKGQAQSVTIDAQVQVDFPGYSNTSAQTSNLPYLGDQTTDVTVGGFVTVPVHQDAIGFWAIRAGAGYTYRTATFSTAVPWDITLKYIRYKSGLFANASLYGLESLKTDGRGITIANQQALNTLSPGTGGSFMSGAINPSLIDVKVQAGYQFDGGNSVTVAFDQPVWGEDSPYGTAIEAGFQMHFGENAGPHGAHRHREEDYTRSNQGFQNYSLDAKVLRSNDRLNLVKIDKGTNDGVDVGQIFDVFSVQADGTVGEAVARCEVVNVKADQAALSVTEYYKEIWIDEGFVAKRLIQ